MSAGVSLPFEGLKVLDFCWVVIGPMTTRYLADYGARVVRVESEHRPDVLRNGEPFAGGERGIDRSGYYANYNSGKESLTLNMADDRARALAFRLATEWADVVAENFTPGTIERWGLGYDQIAAKNPRTDVIVSFPGLPVDYISMAFWSKPDDERPKLIVLGNTYTLAVLKRLISAGWVEAALIKNPKTTVEMTGKLKLDLNRIFNDRKKDDVAFREAFSAQYLLVTASNVRQVARQHRGLFLP